MGYLTLLDYIRLQADGEPKFAFGTETAMLDAAQKRASVEKQQAPANTGAVTVESKYGQVGFCVGLSAWVTTLFQTTRKSQFKVQYNFIHSDCMMVSGFLNARPKRSSRSSWTRCCKRQAS